MTSWWHEHLFLGDFVKKKKKKWEVDLNELLTELQIWYYKKLPTKQQNNVISSTKQKGLK